MLTAICSAQLLPSLASAACRYRSIWRHSRLFVWQDEVGQPWRDVLRTSARKEFEAARDEKASQTALLSALLSWGKGRVQGEVMVQTVLSSCSSCCDQPWQGLELSVAKGWDQAGFPTSCTPFLCGHGLGVHKSQAP